MPFEILTHQATGIYIYFYLPDARQRYIDVKLKFSFC